MKRPNRSGGFTVVDKETPICLPVNNDDEGKLVCKKRLGCLQTLLDNLGEEEDGILHDGDGGCGTLVLGEKKRRLRLDQVKALEKNFDVDNKLEPERKVKLAEELGLQPRQVAVWFQNRRARWKTKQLERDYGVLKAEYESLKLDHEALRSNNEALLARIKEMKTKVEEDGSSSVKEGTLQLVKNEMSMKTTEEKEMAVKENDVEGEEGERSLPALKYKDGSSDSDTSAILNDDGSGGISSSSPSGVMLNPPHHLHHHHHHPDQQQQQLQMCFIGNDCTSSSPFSFLEDSDRDIRGNNYLCNSSSEKQMLTVEEQIRHDFLNDGGGNSIFSDEQVPALPWYYCSDHWK